MDNKTIRNIFTRYVETALKRCKTKYIKQRIRIEYEEKLADTECFWENYNENSRQEEQTELNETLYNALQELRSIEREVLFLKVFGQLSHKEIGARINMRGQQVASIYSYTKKKLRERMKKGDV